MHRQPERPEDAGDVSGPRRSRLVLALLCSAQFLVVLDMTIVNVALPSLQADLGISSRSAHWVMTAYAIAFGGSLLVGGRSADAFGRRRVLVVGAALFTGASLACSLAPNGASLVAARAVHGIGGALLSTAAFGILAASFEAGERRARAIATWASVGSFGAVAGFVLGGALSDLLGWRAVFLAAVPVGCVLVLAAPHLLPESRGVRAPVDATGAALATAGVALSAFVVSSGVGFGTTGIALTGLALATLTSFAARERRTAHPLLPASLLRERSFLTASAAGVAYGSSMLGVLLLLAVYLQTARGLSALQTGLLLLLLRAPSIGWARVAGRLVGHFGPHAFIILGTGLFASGLALLAALPADGSFAAPLLAGLLVLGVAIPCLSVSVSSAALQGVRPSDAGVGSGLITTFQWVGGALGFAVVTAIAGDPRAGSAAHVVDTVRAGLLACSALCVCALAVAVVSFPRSRATPATASA